MINIHLCEVFSGFECNNTGIYKVALYDPHLHRDHFLVTSNYQNEPQETIQPSIHWGPHSVQILCGAAEAVSLAIGHNSGRVTTLTQDTSKLALILPTSEG